MIGHILLGLLGLIVLAFFVPVRVRVEYLTQWRAQVRLFGVIPIWSYPATKPSAKTPTPFVERADKPKKNSLKDEIKTLFRDDGVAGVMRFFEGIVHLLTSTLSAVTPFVTVRKLLLCVRVGGDEANETAVLYGGLSAASATALSTLCGLVRVKNPCVRVVPDFTADKPEARMRMVVWLWPFGVVGALIVALFKFMALWTSMKTPSNGVQHTKTQSVSK